MTGFEKIKKWFKKNGFNEDGYTYVAKGNTYEIKDQLKEAGFIFHKNLLWHIDHEVEEFETEKIHFTEVGSFSDNADFFFSPNALKIVKDKVYEKKAETPDVESQYLDATDGFTGVAAVLKSAKEISSMYGYTLLCTFVTKNNEYLVWFASTPRAWDLKTGSTYLLSGKIKDKKEYNGIKQTYVTRVKTEEIEEG